ncbi:hypothetical protein LEN26_000432 [Aphanomyces euteiches]|nr:hypothetical protein AeMF1_009396 [Aphanomyces euteiches]KAH9163579.1 hypothetical protein LEN26_000432 [Aphanomyces euteiches]KAH9192300.1 hypothetical protein AeNC1_005720 [Aphanomyces euteiches]
MRFAIYAVASLLVGAALIGYTFHTRKQFYPTVIYLVTSKVSVMILCNVALVLVILCGRMFKRIFLGTLRDAELEMLYDHARFTIAETCFTLSVFREEMSLRVLGLFTLLLFIKTFHWLCQWRGEHIEQSEVVSRITHIRLVLLMALLSAVDMTFVVVSGLQVAERGPSVLVLFGFEFLILFVTLVSIFMRYVLHLIDARVEGTWTNKFTYVFYLELFTEVVKLIVYLVFFMIIFTYYGMPLHLLRDLWMSIKSLQRRIVTYFRYRRITANMNERFPNPTEEEMNETDRICIICREEMTLDASKKLPCTHIFHLNCLRMWLQRQQTCPTCRSNIPIDAVRRPDIIPGQNPPPRDGVAPDLPRQQNQPQAAQQPAVVPPAADPLRRDIPARNLPGFNQPVVPPQGGPAPATHTPPVLPRTQAAQPSVTQPPTAPTQDPNRHAAGLPSGAPTSTGLPTELPSAVPSGVPGGFAAGIPSFGTMPFNPLTPETSAHYIQSLRYGLQLDPRFLQYQLDMLQAQLHVLRATSLALQSQTGLNMSMPFVGVPPPATATPPTTTSVPAAGPASTNPDIPRANPPSAPVVTASATATTTNLPVNSVNNPSSPTPVTPIASTQGSIAPVPAEAPSEAQAPEPQPAVELTPEEQERERRREELRRIYSKRYASSSDEN